MRGGQIGQYLMSRAFVSHIACRAERAYLKSTPKPSFFRGLWSIYKSVILLQAKDVVSSLKYIPKCTIATQQIQIFLMAPIRRYLRITQYSVLECRIYLHNPADARWLLNPQDKVLARIFERIRPHVLPKLREENERVKAKKKSNPLKDVIVEG
jgi:hypothetical protein